MTLIVKYYIFIVYNLICIYYPCYLPMEINLFVISIEWPGQENKTYFRIVKRQFHEIEVNS